MSLEKLSEELVEEGRGHPFVEALLVDLRARQATLAMQLAGNAADGAGNEKLWPTGGRMAELAHVIRLITTTKGSQE